MLRKLFKHELIDLFRKTIIFLIGIIALSLIILLLNHLGKSIDFLNKVKGIFITGYIILLIVTMINSIYYPLRRYYQSLFSDEAYLTHTLPVSPTALLFTKIVLALFLFITSLIVLISSLLITQMITLNTMKFLLSMLNANISIAIAIIIIYVIIYYLSLFGLFATSMTVGNSSTTKKLNHSLATGLIIYLIQQGLGMITLGIAYIISPNKESIEAASITQAILISIVPSLLLITGEYIVSHYFLKNKLNL